MFHVSDRRALQDYFVATSVEEALGYLMAHRREARVVAGGTVLMPQVQRGECAVCRLVDVSHVASMRRVALQGIHLVIGGAASLAKLARHELVRDSAPLLFEAAEQMGTPQVRRLATLGGNVASAVGNSDGSVALIALGAEAEIANPTGSQWLPVDSLFVRSGLSRVDSTAEILSALRFRPLGPRQQGSAIERLTPLAPRHRSSLVLALVLSLSDAEEAVIDWASAAAGAARGVPSRLAPVEQALQGLTIGDQSRDLFSTMIAGWALGQELDPSAGSEDALRALAAHAFQRAVDRALGSQHAVAPSGD